MSLSHPLTPLDKWLSTDELFNKLYPPSVRLLANNHWTPLAVAREVALFLGVEKGSKILDIGSGVGKFCLPAAVLKPECFFYGIEQRKDLIQHAETAKSILNVSNVIFTHGNFTNLKFKDYNHFYFYNSFYENLPGTQKIDQQLTYTPELYKYYYSMLYRQLAPLPSGTRLAIYHSQEDEMPPGFYVVKSDKENLLNFLIKE
ncbi:MAG: class I SAM-dependent methyltransferase [Chitinophagaceae bacterium]